MNRLSGLILMLLCGLGVGMNYAQKPFDFDVTTRISAQVGTKSLQPLWSYSNQWGLENMYDKTNVSVYAKAEARWGTEKKVWLQRSALHDSYGTDTIVSLFSIRAGLGGQVSTEKDRTFIHEGYLTGNLWVFDYTIGLHAFTPVFSNNELSSGSYLMSNNARPLPRVGVGLFKYWSLPYTWDLIQVRGSVFFSYMNNEGDKRFTDDILLHEKCAYGRLGTPFVKPYIGLVHSVMMGGKMPGGKKIPLDFWNSMFGLSGSKTKFEEAGLRGEVTNAAGGHQGMWDIGLDLDFPRFSMSAYYQRPFADSKAMHLFFDKIDGFGAKDMTIGTDIRLKNGKNTHINVEFVRTVWQGSEATPDPVVVDKYGKTHYIYPGDLDEGNWREWMEEYIPQEVIDDYESYINRPMVGFGDLMLLFMHHYNKGIYGYGGRTQYASNGFYKQGWSKDGLCMGSALFHTMRTATKYAEESRLGPIGILPLVRLWAINLGVSGDITDKLKYVIRYTYSKNFGNWCGTYKGSFSWDKTPNYFYDPDGMVEHYTMLKATYALKENLTIQGSVSADLGDMYKSASLKLTAIYNL
ncbi:MAG: capsule assembly Wzi family protein [Bacteroidia bacterium]|nr:capsule assembly Wzi family protein [Bacteroidia bacterium]